jgi:hypothetical protein
MALEQPDFPEPEFPNGDVRVYPHLFPRRKATSDGSDEHIATEVRIELIAGVIRSNRKGEDVHDPNIMTIRAVNTSGETLVSIEMHTSDQRQVMESLVYWYAGVGGVSTLREFMEADPIWTDEDDPSRQPGDD